MVNQSTYSGCFFPKVKISRKLYSEFGFSRPNLDGNKIAKGTAEFFFHYLTTILQYSMDSNYMYLQPLHSKSNLV